MYVMKRYGPKALASALVAGAMFFGATAPAAAADPIKIGVIAAESSIPGDAIFNGAELAAEHINEAGGIDGRPVEIFKYDSNSSASDATRAFQRAVMKDGVHAMVGTYISEVALAMMPWSARLKTPFIITGAASVELGKSIKAQPDRYGYVFDAWINEEHLGLLNCFIQRDVFSQDDKLKQFDKAVILAEDAAWTKYLSEVYKECMPTVGVEIVDNIRFAPDTNDFTPIYNRIKRTGANMILSLFSHTGVAPVVQWQQQQVPALMAGINSQAGASKYWKATNGAADGVVASNSGLAGIPITEVTPVFYNAYVERFAGSQPAYTGYSTYDTLFALKHAIEAAGDTDADKVVAALEQVKFDGTMGLYHFTGLDDEKYGHHIVFDPDPTKGVTFLAFQWQDGKQVVIWPPEVADGEVTIPAFVTTD